jgi:1-acyl-sn-glycerol-3-phosphate acyltransferase
MTAWQHIFYRVATRLMGVVVWTFGRYRVEGRERVPARGPLLVVANHLNIADPPLLGAAIPRPIRFMAKQELFDARPGGFFIRSFGAFPVRRFTADLQALRVAQRLLAAGWAVGMFPEGHRSHGRGLQPPFPGTALLALRTGVPVLPVGITGTEAITSPAVLLQHRPVRVVIGEPFTLPRPARITAESVRAASEEIMRRIAALLPPRYRGVYAGIEPPPARLPGAEAEATPDGPRPRRGRMRDR